MSRVLARVLDTPAGPGGVRPRLPTLFEPGLEIASGPEDGAAWPDDAVPGPVPAADAQAARPSAPPNPADPAREPPSAALTVLRPRRPAAEPGPPTSPLPSPLTEPAGRPTAADPRRTEDMTPVHSVGPQPAHPVRPEPVLPAPPSPAGPAASPLRPPGGTATAIMPMMTVDRRPPPAQREPVRPRHQPDAGPAPLWSTARQDHDTAVAEPTVRIEIGRVEISAGRAAPPQPERPASRRRPAAPDLSEYLQRRRRPQ